MGTVCGEHRHIGSTISFTKNRIIVMDLHTSSILYKFLNLYDRTCFMEILYMFLYYSILFNMCIHFLFSIAVHVHLSIIFLFLKSSIFMTLIINTKIHLMFCRNDILCLYWTLMLSTERHVTVNVFLTMLFMWHYIYHPSHVTVVLLLFFHYFLLLRLLFTAKLSQVYFSWFILQIIVFCKFVAC